MEEDSTNSYGFNRRRAEGRDFIDKKQLQLKLKVRKLNPINTISYAQVLGTGLDTHDTSPSVLLFFDNQRFIFNAGEGLQRFCTEHKVKLSKIDHIFLSRVCSETAGGLPGLLLTLAGMGVDGMSVNIWGPSDLTYLVDAMRYFIPSAAMVHTRCFGPPSSDINPSPDPRIFTNPIVLVDNEVVKISAFIIQPCSSKEMNAEEDAVQGKMDNSPKPCSLGSETGHAVTGNMSVTYVCELPEIKGKFHPEKAKALGLNPGPKFRELQLGNSVKSDKQDIMVHPDDVMDPSVPGPIVLIVDCPTERHLQELLIMESFNCYYTDCSDNQPANTKAVTCIIHLSPVSVISSPTYQKWMKKFGSGQHIMAGHEMKNVGIPTFRASARIAARLNYLCPQLFPAPGFCTVHNIDQLASYGKTSGEVYSNDPLPTVPNSVRAENLLKFNLRPLDHLGLDRSDNPSIESLPEIIDVLLLEIPEIKNASQQVRNLWHEPISSKETMTSLLEDNSLNAEPCLDFSTRPSCLENVRRDDLEIVFLGTGSSQPSKYRNVSSIYVNLFSKGGVLLDCGEGTLGQLRRRYGIEGADQAVRCLRCIWISHTHADHHAGLARILALRRDLLRGLPHDPVFVVGPRRVERFLDAYQRLEDLNMQFIDCRHTTEASLNDSDRVTDPLLQSLTKLLIEAGLEALISFPVVHCPQSFGVILKAAERHNSVGKVLPGWKLVYSGDTRPCQELIEACRDATVLIHEATFEDGMMEEAISKNHSTTKEAIDVGASAGAYRIILTHFSQRYPKIPVFDEAHMDKTCIAFDMMSVNIADLPVLPKVLPYVKTLFRDNTMVDGSDD